MKNAIGYLRVSTKEQGRSGLGLAAQRFDIENFARREGFSILAWYQDIQTGAGKDPLVLRPGLATALKEARSTNYPLIVSRLDRLSRNVHFISGLMEHKVHFMVAAFGRVIDNFTLHVYASIAQQERKMIGERVRAAAAILKRQGKKFGLALRSKTWQRHVSALGRAAICREADERAQAYRVYVEWALKQPGPDGRPISFFAAARRLNDRNIKTPLGGRWRGHHLQRMALRLQLTHPTAYMADDVARERVRALWRAQPNLTASKIADLVSEGSPRRLDWRRASAFIREYREQIAKRSEVHHKLGWAMGTRTADRIRIAKIWKRHPDYTGKQIIEKIKGPLSARVPLKFVWAVMHDCRQLSLTNSSSRMNRPRGPVSMSGPPRGRQSPTSRAKSSSSPVIHR